MASVNFEKIRSSAQVKAFIRHCDSEERKKNNHSNQQINKALTDDNLYMFPDESYLDTCNKFDARINELDSTTNTNKRKDRVVCFGLCVPAPAGLNDEQEVIFYANVANILGNRYGEQNIIAGYVHRDEVHQYVNPDTGKMDTSRSHMHLYIVPEKDGILKGKWFSSKANMVSVNNSIDDMCMREFGVPFMTGSKKKGKSVEDLKRRSADELSKCWTALDARESDLKARESVLAQQMIQIQADREKLSERLSEASELISDCRDTLKTFKGQQRINRQRDVERLEDKLGIISPSDDFGLSR